MMMTWGNFQAVVQLSAGLNVAILSFVDISLPAIQERRKVFSKARQELEIHRKNPHKQSGAEIQEHSENVGVIDRQLFDLWRETAEFETLEDSLMKLTGLFGIAGSLIGLSLLVWSAFYYNDPVSVSGMILVFLSFSSLLAAFIINFVTASKASRFTQRCNDIRQKMHVKL